MRICIYWERGKGREREREAERERRRIRTVGVILRTVLNRFWKQHPTKPLQCAHLSPISENIQDEQDMLDKHINKLFLWTPAHRHTSANCVDTDCSQEDLPSVKLIGIEWRERIKGIRLIGRNRWWWGWYIYIYIYIYIYVCVCVCVCVLEEVNWIRQIMCRKR